MVKVVRDESDRARHESGQYQSVALVPGVLTLWPREAIVVALPVCIRYLVLWGAAGLGRAPEQGSTGNRPCTQGTGRNSREARHESCWRVQGCRKRWHHAIMYALLGRCWQRAAHILSREHNILG